jgi:hypothetical protein
MCEDDKFSFFFPFPPYWRKNGHLSFAYLEDTTLESVFLCYQ